VGLTLREGFDLALSRQRELEQTSAELTAANRSLLAEASRRQAAEAQLIEAQKMEAISRLSGGVAHDFNNLLTVILGCTQMSQEMLDREHPAQERLEDIRQAAERAADLTRQLLAFARRQLVEPKVVSVDESLQITRKMLARLLPENIRLGVDTAASEWRVSIDPGQLDQLLVNFVVNARDAMPDGGPLEIRTRQTSLEETLSSALFSIPPGDYVVLEVSDRGTGMDPETERRVFEPFFTTKGETKGTGLGLATCYGIVAQAGGAIFVETALGRGTTFRVFLPRSELPASASAAQSAVTRDVARGETVLVVEDEVGVRQVTVRTLRAAGFEVIETSSLVEGVSAARAARGPLDLLLTDLVLPDGTGDEVARRVGERWPEIRVLYVSGHTDHPGLRRGISSSEVEFLPKPFSPPQLLKRVREVLDRPVARRVHVPPTN
jgi:signal transduction histidine kinase/ActR/RegA family two-component response regulator